MLYHDESKDRLQMYFNDTKIASIFMSSQKICLITRKIRLYGLRIKGFRGYIKYLPLHTQFTITKFPKGKTVPIPFSFSVCRNSRLLSV